MATTDHLELVRLAADVDRRWAELADDPVKRLRVRQLAERGRSYCVLKLLAEGHHDAAASVDSLIREIAGLVASDMLLRRHGLSFDVPLESVEHGHR